MDCSVVSVLCPLLTACVNAGMLDLKHAQEWVVTTKLGSSDKRPGTQMPTVPVRTCRFYAAEMVFSFFVLASASYGIFSVNKWSFSIFLTLQGGQLAFMTFPAFTTCIKPADLPFSGQSDLRCQVVKQPTPVSHIRRICSYACMLHIIGLLLTFGLVSVLLICACRCITLSATLLTFSFDVQVLCSLPLDSIWLTVVAFLVGD